MDWRAFLILSKTRDYERMQFDRRREDYKKTKERILKYSLQNQVKYHTKIGNPSKLCYFSVNNGQFCQRFGLQQGSAYHGSIVWIDMVKVIP